MAVLAEHDHLVEFRSADSRNRHVEGGATIHVHAGHIDLFICTATYTRRSERAGLECRRMGDLRMIPIEEVVDGDFPVAIDDELLNAGNYHHVTARRDQIESEPPGSAQELLQRRCGNVVR